MDIEIRKPLIMGIKDNGDFTPIKANEDGKLGVDLAVDGDGILSTSDIQEYYFDKGALFKVAEIEPTIISGNGNQQYEITNGVSQVRMFEYLLSTVADEYSLCIFEMPNRELDEEVDDVERLHMLVPNRINKKEFPVGIYRLDMEGNDFYSDEEILTLGERIYNRTFILEESQGNQDAGAIVSKGTAIRMDNENYNYVFCVRNNDSTDRDFHLSATFGVPQFLDEG